MITVIILLQKKEGKGTADDVKTKVKQKRKKKKDGDTKKSTKGDKSAKEKKDNSDVNNIDEEKLKEIETNWTYPLRHNEYQFEIQGHFAISMNNRRMYKCDICAGLYRHTFSLKRHYLRNHINCCYLSKADICNCMIVFPSQYLAIQRANNADVLEKMSERLKMPKLVKERKGMGSHENSVEKEIDLLLRENSEMHENSEGHEKSEVVSVKSFEGEKKLLGLYRCNVCNKLFDEREWLISHTENHPVLPDAKLFACLLCNMTFRLVDLFLNTLYFPMPSCLSAV